MLECINKECNLNNNGVCINPTFAKYSCKNRTKTNAPKEENKTNLMEQVKKCVNYEEGYFELLKENEQLKDEIRSFQTTIIELHEEIDQVMEEKENYHTQIVILQEDNKEYKRANEGLAAESKDRLQTIMKLKRQIEDNAENAILSNKVEGLEKDNKYKKEEILQYEELTGEYRKENEKLKSELSNANELIEKKDIKIEKLEKEIKSLKEVVNEGNEQSETEYSNKLFIAEQKINSLNTEIACLKAFKEKDNKRIQHLINSIKNIAETL